MKLEGTVHFRLILVVNLLFQEKYSFVDYFLQTHSSYMRMKLQSDGYIIAVTDSGWVYLYKPAISAKC